MHALGGDLAVDAAGHVAVVGAFWHEPDAAGSPASCLVQIFDLQSHLRDRPTRPDSL